MSDPNRNPFHDLSPEDQERVRQAVGEKFTRDVEVVSEAVKRVTKVGVKLWLEPKISLLNKIYKAIVDEK